MATEETEMTIPARQPQQEYIITADELQKLMSWSTHKSPGVCQYERRLEILRKVETRPHTSPPAPAPEEPEITNKMFDFAIDRVYKKGMKDGAKAGRERVLDEVLNAFLERPDDQFIQYIESLRGAQEEQE
jgi:hypothetical protein